jgi:catechol-2,3-dioxygenase
MSVNNLAVVSLRADDVPQTAHFYHEIVGLQLVEQDGHQPHFDLGGTYLVILKGQPALAPDTPQIRFPMLAFAVEDLDEAMARVRQHGIELPWGVEQDSTSRWVMFYDPAGNLIELVEFGQMHGAN